MRRTREIIRRHKLYRSKNSLNYKRLMARKAASEDAVKTGPVQSAIVRPETRSSEERGSVKVFAALMLAPPIAENRTS